MINSVLERLEFDVKESQAELIVQKNMPTIRCDRIKLGEVFFNLINNALKFSSKNNLKKPRVEVCYVNDTDDHKFFVKDNGIGIEPQYHQKIFGIFKRLHKQSEYEGTGVGLSIVKRIIDDHQGKVWVESDLGKGAIFYFTIPKELKRKKLLGELLIEDGTITKEKLEEKLKEQGMSPPPAYKGET